MPEPATLAVEAARYALLRRLAPSMRHHLVVHLQPIGMVYEVMDRRLKAPQPNLADVQESARKIHTLARAAQQSSLDVVTWLAPEAGTTSPVRAGIDECLLLVGTSFSFRGYALRNEVPDVAGEVGRAAMRNVLTGALIFLADNNTAPAEILLQAETGAKNLDLVLEVRASQGEQGFSTAPAYRPLGWDDMQALAAGDGAGAVLEGTHRLRVSLPWIGGAPAS